MEYLLYCKQYLDHSVIILKDELRQKIEQNVSMKKEISALEDTVKNLKERSREKRKLIETSVGEISNGEVYKVNCFNKFVENNTCSVDNKLTSVTNYKIENYNIMHYKFYIKIMS